LPYCLARREPLSPGDRMVLQRVRRNVVGIEVDKAIEIAEKIDI
jgi:hypothetical protein